MPACHWIRARRYGSAIAAIALVTFVVLLIAAGTDAHAYIVRSSPPEDGLLGAPPQSIELWTSERVATGAGSPAINVLNQDGSSEGITVSNARVDPNDPRHVVADVGGIGAGTFTVVWTVRSEDDGHTLNGSYAFRVAGTSRAPGAASVEGETPRAWAVATRWLTFLGAALAAAGFLYGSFIAGGVDSPATDRRRMLSVVVGGAVALIATIAEPFLQTQFPPEGAAQPSLSDAIAGLPTAWWLRPVALVVVIVLGAVALTMGEKATRLSPALPLGGGAVALVALLGLALTSHASARETWRIVAVPSIVLHQWSVGLWVGGLAQLALSWPKGKARAEAAGEVPRADPVRQFSRYALVLAVVGIGTGVLNAGLVLPTLRSLWESDYGVVLIAKVLILVPVLGLATFHRLWLHRFALRVGSALRSTVRVEAALVLLVVLGGSILALMAPPTVAHGDLKVIDLAAPTSDGTNTADLLVRLQVKPAKPGNNELRVIVAHADGSPMPADQIALVRLGLTSLDHDASQPEVATTPDATGGFVSQGIQLSLDDWWRVDVLVRRLGVEDVSVPFYFRLPDPNVNGFETSEPAGSDDARAVYERGLAGMTSMHTVRWTQRLASGSGIVVLSDLTLRDGSDGQPVAEANTSNEFVPQALWKTDPATGSPVPESVSPADFEQIIIGPTSWQREGGGPWVTGEAGPVPIPSDWGSNYDGATGFHLGRTEDVNGVSAQIVTFLVPGTDRIAPAYYAWWVATDSGRVMQETMVSRQHYMVYEYFDINQPLPIAPPKDAT
ncbi:MAG TPA: copper resistance protein CopC [Thermomicrobiales bacterium]